jgi:hypothetical protein
MQLTKDIVSFHREFADWHQPAQKLHEATLHAARTNAPVDEALGALSITNTVPTVERDRRILLGSGMIRIKNACMILEDQFSVCRSMRLDEPLNFPTGPPTEKTPPVLDHCKEFIDTCKEASLPKLAVETTLYFARMARAFEASEFTPAAREKATTYREESKKLLEEAKQLCLQPFQNADVLMNAVEESIKLLGRSGMRRSLPKSWLLSRRRW